MRFQGARARLAINRSDRKPSVDRSEVIGVAKPREQDLATTAREELRRASVRSDAALAEGLERALWADAVEAARESGAELQRARRRQTVPFQGRRLSVLVPVLLGPGDRKGPPPLFESLKEEDEHGARALRKAGLSTRKVEAFLKERAGGEQVRGTSRSSISRRDVEVSAQDLETVRTRLFHDEPIVQVSLDGTAIGNVGDKLTVMVAIGITADGRRLVLSAWIAQHEGEKEILDGLRDLVTRGVDPRAVWTADQGAGIYAALQRLPAGQRQICTTHVARNVTKELPEEMRQPVRRRMYAAWAKSDADIALAELEALRDELRDLGYEKAASKLGDRLGETLTVTRLGLRGGARKALRSTNPLESINRSIKAALRDVTLWRKDEAGLKDEMILRWVASTLLHLEAGTWKRMPDPRSLVGLLQALMPGAHDPEAILAQLPPNLVVEKIAVPLDEEARIVEVAGEWCEIEPNAVWAGSAGALGDLGLRPGAPVQPAELAKAMRGEHTTSGETVRQTARIKVERRGADGELVEEKVAGLLDLGWELTASPSVINEWNESGPGRRTEIEAGLVAAAGAALEHVTSTTHANSSFLSTMSLTRPADGTVEHPSELRVSGIAVAVKRGREAKVGTPAAEENFRSATARDAEDAAKAVLDRGREATVEAAAADGRPAPEPAEQAPDPAVPRAIADAPWAVVAGGERWALAKGPAMVKWKPEKLNAAAERLDQAQRDLGAVEGEVAAWCESRWGEAVREVAAQPVPTDRSANPWYPLRSPQRMALGEKRAVRLLVDAELLRGKADRDPELRGRLESHGGEALSGLRGPTRRIERFAEALAASHELERRRLLASPDLESSAATTERFAAYDSRGQAVKSPVGRHARALRGYADLVGAHSEVIAAELADEKWDDTALRNLLGALGNPWSDLNPRLGMRQGRLERGRDMLLADHLETVRVLGETFEISAEAEAAKDVGRMFEAAGSARVDIALARRQWGELGEAEALLEDARGQEGCAEQFLSRHPEAALHDAAYSTLLERRRALEPAVAMEPAAAEAGIDLAG